MRCWRCLWRRAAPLTAKAPEPAARIGAPAASGDDEVSVLAYAAPDIVPEDSVRARIDKLIDKYAVEYTVPASLVHHVVNRESTYNPSARNGVYYGLMQIHPRTARTMGYRGPDSGLLDPDTNLRYGVKYLAGAYLVADGDPDRADWLYRTGYYYHAKRKGLLKETGLRP